MKYQVIIEVMADDNKTEWIIGGQFHRRELAELFAAAYERSYRLSGYEAIVVDLESKGCLSYADTDSVKDIQKQKLNSLYGITHEYRR